jgi:hypothetical protein
MAFNHDDHVHKGRDFPVKDNRASKGYRKPIKDGSRAFVDHDIANNNLTGNHAADDHFNAMVASGLHLTVQLATAAGATSKARKAQRQLNNAVEARLAIRVSWCPGCLNYLHNCQCAAAEARGAAAASLDLIRRVYADIEGRDNDYKEQLDDARRQRRKDKRLQRKADERAAKGKDGI